MKNKPEINLLEGNLVPLILKLAFPVALDLLAQTLYDLTDAFWLGKLGKEVLAAPTISSFLENFLISIGLGFSIAGTTLVAQYAGAKEKEKICQSTGNLMIGLTILSIILTGLGLIFADDLLRLLKTPPDAFGHTMEYYRIVIGGMPLLFPFFVYQAVMNGKGDTLAPLKITLCTATANAVLDPIFIFGIFGFPITGAAGAALATALTRASSSLIGLYFLFSGRKGIDLKWHHLKPNLTTSRLLLKIGTPSAVGFSGSSLGFILLMGIVDSLGTAVVSAYGIVTRVIHFFMLPAMGISSAVTTLVGQNLGANNVPRAKQTVIKGIILMVAIVIPVVIILMIFGKQITMLFIPTDRLIHQMGRIMFYLAPASLIFFGVSTVIQGAFQGAGYTIPVMIANISRIWLFRVPVVYLLSMIMLKGGSVIDASLGIWWGMLFSNFAAFVIIYAWYMNGKWARSRLKN
ncbi:MAG: MATE family efflux transporter [Candidatus Omnitrophota bacterium]